LLVLAVNPGHDGAIAVVRDRVLEWCLESEKDSFLRHASLTPMSTLSAIERLDAVPDVVAIGGWRKEWVLGSRVIEAGYSGIDAPSERLARLCGGPVRMFSSSHIRSHLMMAAGMAPRDDAPLRAVLVWEGIEGTFYLLDEEWKVVRTVPVLHSPGGRYAFVYTIAEPSYADFTYIPALEDSGKLMALAAFGDPSDADPRISATVDRLLTPSEFPWQKIKFKDSPLFNAGVEAEVTKITAALLTERMFDLFAEAAQRHLPEGIPLHISGGCGLNCDWNQKWRELGYFSSVFVPPCTNDSGSAVGTALDALAAFTGDPRVDWNVYSGLEFVNDLEPDPEKWERRPLDYGQLAEVLNRRRVVAWVQGRWEMGPRALGNRSLLAEPFHPYTRELLNVIKQREAYRPIAPCCRMEDVGKVFDDDWEDPYMLYFRRVRASGMEAVTHVDGSARAQTVTRESNRPLHDLLTAFAERRGVGVLCNTSLNFKGFGFINRMTDLIRYCEGRKIRHCVVGQDWFIRRRESAT
jgi:hydroxymethyl cephem carbamoyltransferase